MSCSMVLYRLYDVADNIDLNKAQDLWSASNQISSRLRLARVSPKAIAFKAPPLTVELGMQEIPVAGRNYAVETKARLYDFGVINLVLRLELPRDIPYEDYLDLAIATDHLPEDRIQQFAERVLDTVHAALLKRRPPEFGEDFTVYYFREWNDWDVVPLLLKDRSPINEETRQETLSNRLSYANDVAYLVWDSAFVYDPSGSTDIPDLLEFANAQYLELRYYDGLLEQAIVRMYEAIEDANTKPGISKLGKYRRIRREMLELMADVTAITSRITNSLRVTEDVFYARVYGVYLRLLRVSAWKDSILEKVEIIQHSYNQLTDEVVTRRSEVMELIVILLIAFEIVLTLWEHASK